MLDRTLVKRIYGQVAEDGSAISLQLQTHETIFEVALAKDDIAGLVHMLLALVCESETHSTKPRNLGSCLPVTSVWLGDGADGEALLGLQIGAVRLSFSLAREKLGRLGRAFLTASTVGNLPL
jgi:hypothetical protein